MQIAADYSQGPRRLRRTATRVIADAQREIGRYLAVITASNSLVGLLTGLLVWMMGLPSPIVWGAIGVLIAVPLMTVILVVLSHLPAMKPVHQILAR